MVTGVFHLFTYLLITSLVGGGGLQQLMRSQDITSYAYRCMQQLCGHMTEPGNDRDSDSGLSKQEVSIV